MDQICLVVPILSSRTADAKDFMRELEAGRNADYQRAKNHGGSVVRTPSSAANIALVRP